MGPWLKVECGDPRIVIGRNGVFPGRRVSRREVSECPYHPKFVRLSASYSVRMLVSTAQSKPSLPHRDLTSRYLITCANRSQGIPTFTPPVVAWVLRF